MFLKDPERGRRSRRERRIRFAADDVQEELGLSVTSKTKSSGSDPFPDPRFAQLSQEAAMSMQIRSTDVGWLSRMLGDETERN